jgi:RNA polymerase sigma-70 factor (ECF subfamily)
MSNKDLQSIDEWSLLQEFRRTKDPQLFQKLIEPHIVWLQRLCWTIFHGNYEDAQDAFQEILILFFSGCLKFKNKSSFKTFFYSFARFKAIDYLRKVKKQDRNIHKLPIDETIEHSDTPEDVFLKKEVKTTVFSAIDSLNPEERSLILMKEVESYSLESISDITGIKIGTLKSRLFRIRQKLQDKLKGGNNEQEYMSANSIFNPRTT